MEEHGKVLGVGVAVGVTTIELTVSEGATVKDKDCVAVGWIVGVVVGNETIERK